MNRWEDTNFMVGDATLKMSRIPVHGNTVAAAKNITLFAKLSDIKKAFEAGCGVKVESASVQNIGTPGAFLLVNVGNTKTAKFIADNYPRIPMNQWDCPVEMYDKLPTGTLTTVVTTGEGAPPVTRQPNHGHGVVVAAVPPGVKSVPLPSKGLHPAPGGPVAPNASWQDTPWVQDERTIFIADIAFEGDSRVIFMYSKPIKSLEDFKKAVEEAIGKVQCVKFLMNPQTGKPKRCAFVTMVKKEDADKALRDQTCRLKRIDCSVSAAAHSTVVPRLPAQTSFTDIVPFWTDVNPLFERTWVDVGLPHQGGPVLRILTWNILFPGYINNHEHYCPVAGLAWSHREGRILDALSKYNADIVTLQEIPDSTIWESFKAKLGRRGYNAVHHRKITNRAEVDGVAVLYRSSRCREVPTGRVMCRMLPTEPQVGLAVELEVENSTVIVATTHLKAAKLSEDCRVEQMKNFLVDIAHRHGTSKPLLLSGDFNSEPRWKLVRKLKEGDLGSPFGSLGEAYTDHASKAFEDKQYTCYMPFTQDQLDYIFHSEDLRPVRLMAVPSDLEVVRVHKRDTVGIDLGSQRYEMLPTPSFPSDHIPIACDFALPKAAAAKQHPQTTAQQNAPVPQSLPVGNGTTAFFDFYIGKSKCSTGETIHELLSKGPNTFFFGSNPEVLKWLFPNCEGPELDMMVQNKDVRGRALDAFRVILGFYGMELADNDVEVIRCENATSRFGELRATEHSWGALPNVLRFLGQMGFAEHQAAWLRRLMLEAYVTGELSCIREELEVWLSIVTDVTQRGALWSQLQGHLGEGGQSVTTSAPPQQSGGGAVVAKLPSESPVETEYGPPEDL